MAKFITKFEYSRLRNEAHVEFNATFITLINKYGASQLNIQMLFDSYQTLFADEVSVLDLVRRSVLTREIWEQDARRNDIFRGFADAAKSSLHHFDHEKRTAARKLDIVFENYGNISIKTLDQKSAAIDDLLREVQTEQYTNIMLLLGLEEWANELRLTNERFTELMMERYRETASRPTIQMRATRLKVDKAFRAIINQVEALVLVSGISVYAPFIKDINVVMEHYRNILAQEKGRRKQVNE
jgi:hypothetical protein